MNYSGKLSLLENEIYKAIQTQVDLLPAGTTLMLIGDEMNVPTDEVKGLIVILSDSDEEDYHELPYAYIYDKHGHPMQYKVAGLSKIGDAISLHLHSWEECVEYRHTEKSNVEASMGVMADIADMI
jgi:hypothetical protein